MKFVPLHVYSEYSFLNSGLTLEKYFNIAKKNGYKTLGISDLNVMFGFPHFTQLAKIHNIKPILGFDLVVNNFLLSLFVCNEEGYLNALKIINTVNKEDPCLDFLIDHQEGILFVVSINITNYLQSQEFLNKLCPKIKNFYLGLEIYDEDSATKLHSFFEKDYSSFKFIMFPHIKYLNKDDALVLDIVEAIKNNHTLDYDNKSGEQYLKDDEQLNKLYKLFPLTSFEKLLENINFDLNKTRGKLLKFSSDNSKELLFNLTSDGLKRKNKNDEKYKKRLEYELKVIDEMGFNDYFLIVNDYVNYARTHDILVGPGRGSAAGSLVSYALDITTPDPIKYDLYFERFLNQNRKTMPDIDIDFEDIKREQVIDYLKKKYGKDRVSNIVTFQTIGAKQAIRDIGRVFNIRPFEIDYLSKTLGSGSTTFKDSYRNNKLFKDLIDKEPHYLNIVRLASKIEGLIRQSSIHAAGIILNDTPLFDVLPILKDADNNLITQYEMTYLEEQGFLKMDLLALKNLTIIKEISSRKDINLNPYLIPIDDEKAINLINNNLTMGIFQLESSGMKHAIELLKPNSFDDVSNLIALFRPGPMDNIKSYANRKDGLEKVPYLNNELKEILSPTYGIIIYQEQIMQIVTKMAGLSLKDADDFRRSISKKDLSKMSMLKEQFINGAIKNGYQRATSLEVFQTIEKFASYGFNKAHSISYAHICTQMAYLKAHYPLDFYIVLMENESAFTNDKFYEYLKEMRLLNISLLLPNINTSDINFIKKDGQLLFPLSSIKGLNMRFVLAIIEERKKGKFIDFFDFVNRLYKEKINEDILLRLIDAGAFDEFKNRQTLRESIHNALNQAMFNSTLTSNLLSGDDFGLHFDYVYKNDDALYNLKKEYEVLGVNLSSSLFDTQKDKLSKYHVAKREDALYSLLPVNIAVCISRIKKIKTKNGRNMAYLSCFDDSGDLEVVMFPNEYEKYWRLLKQNCLFIIRGTIDKKDKKTFILEDIKELEN